jgi:hypothetical protein
MDETTTPSDAAAPAPEPTGGPPPASGAARGRGLLVGGLSALVVVVIAAAAFAFFALRGSGEILARSVPDDADVYFTAYLNPSAGQKLSLQNLLHKFPKTSDDAKIEQAITDLFRSSKTDYQNDIKPWLGDQVAFAAAGRPLGSPQIQFGALVQSKNDGLAQTEAGKIRDSDKSLTFTQQTYAGVTLYVGSPAGAGHTSGGFGSNPVGDQMVQAYTSHTLLFSNSVDYMHNIIDTMQGHHPSLESTDEFKRVQGDLPGDKLALLYWNVGHTYQELSGVLAAATNNDECTKSMLANLGALRGFGLTLGAKDQGFVTDWAVDTDNSKLSPAQKARMDAAAARNSQLQSIPPSAYGFLTMSGLDGLSDQLNGPCAKKPGVSQQLDQLGVPDFVKHLSGDGALEVDRGTTGATPSGALILGTNDEGVTRTFFGKLAEMAMSAGKPTATGSAAVPMGLLFGDTVPTGAQTSDYKGVTIVSIPVPQLADAGLLPSYAVFDKRGVIAASPAELHAVIDAERGGANVTAQDNYKSLGSDGPETNKGQLYLDLQSVIKAVRDALPASQQTKFDQDAAPNLAPLKALAITGSGDSSTDRGHMIVTVR